MAWYDERVQKSFTIWETLKYPGRPQNVGFKPAIILYESMLWRNGEPSSGPPTNESLDQWIDLLNSLKYKGLVVLDIEHWPIYTDTVTRQYMIDIVTRFRVRSNGYKVGYYAMLPDRDMIGALSPWTPQFTAWKARNTFVKPIADACDVIFPSLYTIYPDSFRWEYAATQNIIEARRLAGTKPVVAFLWPQYHEAVVGATPLAYLDSELWHRQLVLTYQLCDGMILWNINPPAEVTWSNEMPWYKIARSFATRFTPKP